MVGIPPRQWPVAHTRGERRAQRALAGDWRAHCKHAPLQVAWCLYMTWWPVYHALEFGMTAWFNAAELKWNCEVHRRDCGCARKTPPPPPPPAAFLLDQSNAYVLAVTLSVVEFWGTLLLLPDWKRDVAAAAGGALLLVGASVMWVGQAVRSTGMATAGFGFTHLVQDARREGHELVTHGIYAVLRHPGYTGWFYASIATQVLLGNPLCTLLYIAAAQRFFATRIPREEYRLFRMFGGRYLAYRARTLVLIPGIPDPLADAPGA